MAVRLGTQFTGRLGPNETRTWFTHSWNANWNVAWACIPTAPVLDGGSQIEWDVRATRQTATLVKWFIVARNKSSRTVDFQARYAIVNA